MQRRADGDVLKDGDSLAVGREHRRIVIIVRHSHLYVCRVYVTRVRVLNKYRHVEERMQQRVKVNRLKPKNTTQPLLLGLRIGFLVECYSNHTTTRISIQTAGLAFGGTSLCSYRVRGVDGSCAKHLTVESYMVIYAANSYTYYY